mgnify:CR=1 FL=1
MAWGIVYHEMAQGGIRHCQGAGDYENCCDFHQGR